MTVILPTHERIPITTVNIRLLLAQGFEVVVVVSTPEELRYYSTLDVYVVIVPNSPLGRKFQAGVDFARHLNPDGIVILGSDDLLSVKFSKQFAIKRDLVVTSTRYGVYEQLISEGVKVAIGFKQWYVWSGAHLYHFEYLASQPLGGGRVYPRILLEALDWKLFDPTRNRLLDDYAYDKIKNSYGQRMINEPHILAVKGDWAVMNPLDLKHKNVKVLASYEGEEARQIMKTNFNYEP